MEVLEARRLLAWAGPDGYGYEANEYPYEALDLVPGDAGVNSILDGGDDDAFATVPLGGNSFRFYGTSYSSLIVSINGLITFGSSNAYFANSNMSSTPTERAIAPLWDDWKTDVDTVVSGPLNDVVLYKFDMPNNRLIVEWNAVRNISTPTQPTESATFQAMLQLNTGANDGSMTFNYVDLDVGNVSISNGGAATVGIKDAGPQGANVVLVSFNSNGHPLVQSEAALRITRGPPTSSGSISGKAFHDWNLNGVIDGSEQGIGNATVYLDLNLNGTKDGSEPSTLTDGAGNYSITGLADGPYTVREDAPTGFHLVGAISTAVSSGGATTNVNPANYRTIFAGTSGNDPYTLRKNGAGQFEIVQSGGGTYLVPGSSAWNLEFGLQGGDDTLTVDYANGDPVPAGGVYFDGGNNGTSTGDTLIVTGSALADTINLYGIGGGQGVVAGAITVLALEHVTVNGGAGNDVLTVNPFVNAPITFNGDANVDTLNYVGSNISEFVTLTLVSLATANIHGDVNTVSFVSIPEQIVVNGLGGNDALSVASVLAGVSVTLLGGSGDDQFTTGLGGSSSEIDGNVTFNGGGGIDQLSWNDYLVSTSGLTYSLASTSLTRTGTGVMTLTQLSGVNVLLGPATVTVNVTSTPTGRATTITGGNAADAINLGPSLDNLAGSVTFTDGFAGDNDVITLNDSTNPFSQSYAVTSSAVARSLFGGLNYSGAEGLALLCQSGSNSISVNAGIAFPATTINGNGGTDSLVVSGAAGADTVSISASSVITQNGSIAYLGVEALTLNAGTGNDTVTLNATNATTPVTISGDDGNDTLTISGAPSSGVLFKGGLLASDQDVLNVNAGTYTFQADAKLSSVNLKVNVGSAGTVVFNSTQHLADLVVTGKAVMGADGSRYLHAKKLSIGPSGKLDLNDNDIIVEYSSAPFVAYDQVWGWIFSGYSAEVDSTKVGIVSTSGQLASGVTLLEVIDNATVEATEWPLGSGNMIPVTSIIGKYTYVGDADWDGQVTPQDYTAVDASLGSTQDRRIAILSRDLDFDNVVTPQDYTVIDSSLGLGMGNPLGVARVKTLELGNREWEDLV